MQHFNKYTSFSRYNQSTTWHDVILGSGIIRKEWTAGNIIKQLRNITSKPYMTTGSCDSVGTNN